jgi:hypothetical protein
LRRGKTGVLFTALLGGELRNQGLRNAVASHLCGTDIHSIVWRHMLSGIINADCVPIKKYNKINKLQ